MTDEDVAGQRHERRCPDKNVVPFFDVLTTATIIRNSFYLCVSNQASQMALITTIIAVEEENTDSIHLFREGLFYRAYQHSAFQFISHVRNFKAVKKDYKAVGQAVAILGFPTSRLDELFPDRSKVEVVEEGQHIRVSVPELDPKAYAIWFRDVAYPPVKPKKPVAAKPAAELLESALFADPTPAAPVPPAIPAPPAPSGDVPLTMYGLLREIQDFSIERSSPLECMLFLSSIQAKLKGHGGL